jgi:hypothetical protein
LSRKGRMFVGGRVEFEEGVVSALRMDFEITID